MQSRNIRGSRLLPLPPSSFSFQHRFFSPSFAPIPSNTSSLLSSFFSPSLYFQPFFFFFLLLWPHASKILLYLVSIGRQRERVFREGIFWLGVQCIQVQCIRAGCVGLLAHFFARNPCNRFSSSSFLLFFYLVSSVLEIFTGFTRYREKSWQGFFEGWGRGLKERLLVVFEDWVVEGVEGFLTRVFEIRLDFLLSRKKFEISNKYWEYLGDVFERISFCRVFRENSGERYGNQFADASVR